MIYVCLMKRAGKLSKASSNENYCFYIYSNLSNMQKRYHFISIGGAAMHNLAIALKLKGAQVTGSDDEIYEPSRSRLQ